MWFKRKPKNKRLERRHVLDVKLRSQHTRAVRIRLATTIFLAIVGISVSVLTLWKGSDWALDELVFKNPSFSIRKIDIQTDGDIPFQQIRWWAGVKEGDNLFSLDILRIKRDLELVSLIRAAAVERVLPDTLKIRITERDPVAQIFRYRAPEENGQPKSGACYIDESGYVIDPLVIRRPEAVTRYLESLPVLMGVSGTEAVSGRRLESAPVQGALRFLSSFNHSPMTGLVDIKSIDLSAPEVFQVTTRQGNEITFTLQSLEMQLRRWRIVHDYALGMGKSVAFLDLSVSNNVPARWQELGSIAPLPPKPAKPSRTLKKHV